MFAFKVEESGGEDEVVFSWAWQQVLLVNTARNKNMSHSSLWLMNGNDIWRENNNQSLRVAFGIWILRALNQIWGGFNPCKWGPSLLHVLTGLFSVVILVEGKISGKTRGYKAPMWVGALPHSDGSAWKETPNFVHVFPGSWQNLQAKMGNLFTQVKEKINNAQFGLRWHRQKWLFLA